MNERTCCACGQVYDYISTNPLGASSTFCPSCQKRQAKQKKKFNLLLIAGNGQIQCRACGYRKYPYAIIMRPARDYIHKPEPEVEAKTGYLVCLNCNAAIDSGDIKVQIVNTKEYPVVLEIYDQRVTVEDVRMNQHIPSGDAEELEVVNERQTPTEFRNVSGTTKRLD